MPRGRVKNLLRKVRPRRPFLMAGGGTRTRTPPEGTPDFKSPVPISACLGRSEFFLLTRPIRRSDRLRHLGLSRRVSLPPCCHPGDRFDLVPPTPGNVS